MSKIDLHIVSFDVPSPPNYGGVIDVFYRLKSLKELGYCIALHCFEYGRGESEELNQIADKVFYYERKKALWSFIATRPFIVKSRMNRSLLENLLSDSAPILLEGIHCTGYLNNPNLKDRIKWIRMHNVESDYYAALSKQTSSLIRKIFYFLESIKLKAYEQSLEGLDGVLCISEKDKSYFEQFYENVKYLAVFHEGVIDNVKVDSKDEYALFQGNLKVEENIESIYFLLKVFSNLPFRLIIAGNEPSKALKVKVESYENVKLIASPTKSEMNKLIKNAKVNCLPSFQNTGVKLKLITALLNGRYVLVNEAMLTEENLNQFCETAESIEQWVEKVKMLMNSVNTFDNFENRKEELNLRYNNISNAKYLMELLAEVQ